MALKAIRRLSDGRDVLLAGEIALRNGQIIHWGNGRGHHKPNEMLRHSTLTSRVKSLLPENKLVNCYLIWWAVMKYITESTYCFYQAIPGYNLVFPDDFQ